MVHAWSFSVWDVYSNRMGKSFFIALAESAAHLAVVKTNEEFKSARQEDHVSCLQALGEQDPIGGGGPNGQREL